MLTFLLLSAQALASGHLRVNGLPVGLGQSEELGFAAELSVEGEDRPRIRGLGLRLAYESDGDLFGTYHNLVVVEPFLSWTGSVGRRSFASFAVGPGGGVLVLKDSSPFDDTRRGVARPTVTVHGTGTFGWTYDSGFEHGLLLRVRGFPWGFSGMIGYSVGGHW